MNPQILLLILEILSVAALLTGVALMHVPAAFVLGGILGVLGCEMHARSTVGQPDK